MKRHSFLGDGKRVNVDVRPTPPTSQLVGRGELRPRPTPSIDRPKKPSILPKVKAITVITLIPLILVFAPMFLGNTVHSNIEGDGRRWMLGFAIFLLILCGLGLLFLSFIALHVVYEDLEEYFNKKK